MPADLTILGAPRVTLAHTTGLPDADLFVRISDVDPKRRSRNVTERYTRLGELPDLEEFALFETAHTFRAGHRIRLIIAGGSFPQFTRNPGTRREPPHRARAETEPACRQARVRSITPGTARRFHHHPLTRRTSTTIR